MNNRNEARWAPFQSLFHISDTLFELEEYNKKTSKPILSPDELEILERKVLNACHTRTLVEVDYYYQGACYKKKELFLIFPHMILKYISLIILLFILNNF